MTTQILVVEAGHQVGVVTNDQGKYLVDSAFVASSGISKAEVTGGCFCCRFEDLEARLEGLIRQSGPSVIFAESVGSCTDLVATVMEPLRQFKRHQVMTRSLTIYADARLLQRRLAGLPLPFSEPVAYLFDKQLEEAGLVVVNKIDLIPEDHREPLLIGRFRHITRNGRFCCRIPSSVPPSRGG